MTALVEHWVNGGGAVGLVIATVVAEMLVLGFGMKGRAGPILIGLIPGLCLILALRAAILGHGALWIMIWVTASLPFHLIDLYQRIKEAGRPGDRPD